MFREDQLIRPGLLTNCVIKTSTSFACQSRHLRAWLDVSVRFLRATDSAELDPLATSDIQAVGRSAFLQENLDIPVAVDHGLGSIG